MSASQASAGRVWTGRVLSGIVVAFLLFDAVGKLVPVEPVIKAMADLGFASTQGLARSLGVLLLCCTVLHIVPRTAALGAVLLTGYLGGTIAVQLRAGNPMVSHVLFGGYIGIILWIGFLLRNKEVRAIALGR